MMKVKSAKRTVLR